MRCMSEAAFWVQIDDPRFFPQGYKDPFPANFMQIVQTIFKRLFRVYAHIYHSHFRSICALSEEAHLNTCFKHFMHFTQVGKMDLTHIASLPILRKLQIDLNYTQRMAGNGNERLASGWNHDRPRARLDLLQFCRAEQQYSEDICRLEQ